MIGLALPKGRLVARAVELLQRSGCDCGALRDGSRRLAFTMDGIRVTLVKPSDVAVYVEHGAADIGIVGKDVLLEDEPDVFELMDLRFGACRMVVAAPAGYVDDPSTVLRVASKYPRTAAGHFARRNRAAEVIPLHGSIELAPLVGLSDVIVDIVETGTTLRENGLEVVEEIAPLSARLIANRARYHFAREAIERLTAPWRREAASGRPKEVEA
ncbi:MAG: ATP phosphoribosyltransferase [Fretibacterium sp.]|nr:ATP phosphoribosyltransferase [Fretibacterium sp.]